jgi:dTDP-4-amino-4,6-dideoxygalactose transaminase
MILLNDFKAESEEIKAAQLEACQRVIASGWYVLGKEVEAFEQEWAQACQIPHAIGVGNGMDAIEIALRTLDIGEGDEVITTPMTAFATVLAILRSGASPVLADIDPETGLLDPVSVERCINPRTKAVIPVHLYGQIRNMESWLDLCERTGIQLIEDCAQSHLAMWNGKYAGSFGAMGAYSFYPTKNLGCLGDGGACITSDAMYAERAKRLRNYGQSVRYEHPEIGMNSRLDEMQAAILRVRLQVLQSYTDRRRNIAKRYLSEINNSPWIQHLAAPLQENSHSYHLFVLRTPHRSQVMDFLQSQGVQVLIHYPIPVHQQKTCLNMARDPQGLKHAEHHAQVCFSIPIHPQMSDADVEHVIQAVNAFKI